jgi:enterobactin synthetase component F
LVGYVRLTPGTTFDETAVRRVAGQRVPASLVPSRIETVESWPISANGKLDRARLGTLQPAARLGLVGNGIGGGRAVRPLEEVVAGAMARALGVDAMPRDRGFFDEGGTSLDAARLVGLLHAAIGRDVPIETIYRQPTPAGLAASLTDDAETPAFASATWLRRPPRTGRTLAWVHPAGGLAWVYARANPHLPPDVAVIGLNHPGLGDPALAHASIAELARRHWACLADLGIDLGVPIWLAGWSLGGVVAHQMAASQPDRAAGLGLVDAYPPHQWRGMARPPDADPTRALLLLAGVDQAAPEAEPAGAAAGGSARVAWLRDRLSATGSPLAAFEDDKLKAILRVAGAAAAVMRAHSPLAYAGPVHVFEAAAPRAEQGLNVDGWRQVGTPSLVHHRLDCTHPEMATAANLAHCANALLGHLDDADRAAPVQTGEVRGEAVGRGPTSPERLPPPPNGSPPRCHGGRRPQ